MPPTRRRPVHGVYIPSSIPVIVFDTICSKGRAPNLGNDLCHSLLREAWREARGWLVGRYVVMPDHIHLFAAPGEMAAPYEQWTKYWKRTLTRACKGMGGDVGVSLQDDHWERRLRADDDYLEKWKYVSENPVRRGLVVRSEEWPYQGEMNVLRWDR